MYPQVGGFQKYGAFFLRRKPRATYPQVRGFQKSEGRYSERKKVPAAMYPQVGGFQKYGGHFSGTNASVGLRSITKLIFEGVMGISDTHDRQGVKGY